MPTRREKQLYGSIGHALKLYGFPCVRHLLTMPVSGKPKADKEWKREFDHVAWRWRDGGGEPEIVAVEAKAGSTAAEAAVALGQATEYQAAVPLVFVASEGDLTKMGHLDRVLKHLNLGYIQAAESTAKVQREPAPSPFLDERVYRESVARVRLLDLWADPTCGVPGAQHREHKHDLRGNLWVVTEKDRWQLCGEVKHGEPQTTLSLLAENKEVGTRFCNVPPEVIREVLVDLEARLGETAALVAQHRFHPGTQPSYCPLFTWDPSQPLRRLRAGLKKGLALAERNNHGPQFTITFRLWPHDQNLNREQAKRQLLDLASRLEPVRVRLDEAIGSQAAFASNQAKL